jgi:hypothetical protein
VVIDEVLGMFLSLLGLPFGPVVAVVASSSSASSTS